MSESQTEYIDVTPHGKRPRGVMNVLVRDVDIDLLRQQLHYMSEMSCMDYCFQGSPLFGAHSAPEGLEGVRKTLERMLGSTI